VGGYSSLISKKGLMLGSQNNEGFVKGGRDGISRSGRQQPSRSIKGGFADDRQIEYMGIGPERGMSC
jgi:hypothetical protein